MAFAPGKNNFSYKSLTAKTTDELERLMLEIALREPYQVSFTAPTYSNSKWITWYLADWSKVEKPKTSKP